MSTLTCCKIDAGVAVLIGQDAHLIEFPSVLLPPGCEPGSIVSVVCTRDHSAERARKDAFWKLQDQILSEFGQQSPSPPVLRIRNVTQTSVTLEWEPLQLAAAKLLDLTLWRNNSRLAAIPSTSSTSTKCSGLDVDAEYSFHLVAKTTAGTYTSAPARTRTHKISDCSGVRVVFGHIDTPELRAEAEAALQAMGGEASEAVQSLVTTHFICTSAGPPGATSTAFQRAAQLSIPTVQPSWLIACAAEKRMVSIAAHYSTRAQARPAEANAADAGTAPPS